MKSQSRAGWEPAPHHLLTGGLKHLYTHSGNGYIDVVIVGVDGDRVSTLIGNVADELVGFGIDHSNGDCASEVIVIVSGVVPNLVARARYADHRLNAPGSGIYCDPARGH